MSNTVKVLPTSKKLRPTKFTQPGVKNRTWHCYAEAGHTFEDVIDPSYWGVVANKVMQGDRISVLAEDLSWAAEFVVVGCSGTWVAVAPLYGPIELKVAQTAQKGRVKNKDADDYEIKHIAGTGFRVVRKSDKMTIADNLPDNIAADKALKEYLATVNRS